MSQEPLGSLLDAEDRAVRRAQGSLAPVPCGLGARSGVTGQREEDYAERERDRENDRIKNTQKHAARERQRQEKN